MARGIPGSGKPRKTKAAARRTVTHSISASGARVVGSLPDTSTPVSKPKTVTAKPYIVYPENDMSDYEGFDTLDRAVTEASTRAKDESTDRFVRQPSDIMIARVIGRVKATVEVTMEE